MDTTIRPELLEELLKNVSKPDELFGRGGLVEKLKGALMERVLDARTPSNSARASGCATTATLSPGRAKRPDRDRTLEIEVRLDPEDRLESAAEVRAIQLAQMLVSSKVVSPA